MVQNRKPGLNGKLSAMTTQPLIGHGLYMVVIIVPTSASSMCFCRVPSAQPHHEAEEKTQLLNSLMDGVSKALPAKVRVGKRPVTQHGWSGRDKAQQLLDMRGQPQHQIT